MKSFNQYIWPYIKQYKWLMFATVFLGILTFITAGMLTFTSGYLITRAAEMPLNILLLYVPIIGVRTFGIARPVVRYLERLTGHNTMLKILAEMRVKLYDVLEPQAIFIRSRFKTGDLVGTLSDDIEHLQDAYVRTIFPIVVALFLLLFTVGGLAIFDWRFALWILFCLSMIVFVYPLISLYVLKKNQVRLKAKKGQMYQDYTDAVMGASDWIISGRKNEFLDQFMKDSKKAGQIDRKLTFWNHARTFQLQVITGIVLIFVGIWAGFEAHFGSITPAYIASFTLITLPIIEGLVPVSNAVEKIPTFQESLNRIDSIRQFMPEPKSVHKSSVKPDSYMISIKNVTYRYERNQESVLKNISLSIPHRSKAAILGKSGAGKSTLLSLMVGAIEPTFGSVDLGGIRPHEIGDKIYDYIGVLNQKPYLFATTVENNIRLGKQDATDAEIEDVIQKVKLDEYIHSLPMGLKTQMQESGQRFSGGERQRIALARILLKNTPIVILDEPTVGLDPVTERDLLATIFATMHDKTLIIITHHLLGLEEMDQIVFLDDGHIVMSGSHHELIAKNDRYRQLYELDYGGVHF